MIDVGPALPAVESRLHIDSVGHESFSNFSNCKYRVILFYSPFLMHS